MTDCDKIKEVKKIIDGYCVKWCRWHKLNDETIRAKHCSFCIYGKIRKILDEK